MPTTGAPAGHRIRITAGKYKDHLATVLITRPAGACTVRVDDDPSGKPRLYQQHEFTDAQPNALLITPAGAAKPVNIPAGKPQRRAVAAQLLEGDIEYTRLASCAHGVHVLSLASRQHSEGQPVNEYATLIISVLPGSGPRFEARGPVLFFGPIGDGGWPTDLEVDTSQIIQRMIGAMHTAFSSLVRP
ncbi:hypothetical protein [Kitasatospora sp. NPDC015120]|uniref:hypothetical protein n=1 Tax=Kitasatospora sp. NPDC015120 TaxID=3364023 RepID=UPI0036F45BD3